MHFRSLQPRVCGRSGFLEDSRMWVSNTQSRACVPYKSEKTMFIAHDYQTIKKKIALFLKKVAKKFGDCIFMSYLCSVYPEEVGRKADSRVGQGPEGAAGSEARSATRGWLKAPKAADRCTLPKCRPLSPNAPRRPTPGRDAAVAALRIN